MRYFMHLSYQGTNYRGWQSQLMGTSVQEKIENAFEKVLKTRVTAFGCGRTDALVHGLNYVAHFTIESVPDFDLKERLNYTLPADISIHEIIRVENWNHCRYDAISRSYTYIINTKKCAFKNNFASYYPIKTVNQDKIVDLVEFIKKQTNFKAFCNSADKHNSTECKISKFNFQFYESESLLVFNITANRFLKQMIRILMGVILKYNNSEILLDQIKKGFETGIIDFQKSVAHPSGLYFSNVEYDYIKFKANPIWPNANIFAI